MKTTYSTYDEVIKARTGAGLSMSEYGDKLNKLMIKAQAEGATTMGVSWSGEDGFILNAVRTIGLRRTEMEAATPATAHQRMVDALRLRLKWFPRLHDPS